MASAVCDKGQKEFSRGQGVGERVVSRVPRQPVLRPEGMEPQFPILRLAMGAVVVSSMSQR